MKKMILEIEVDYNFEPGDCGDCPLQYTEWYDDDGWTDYIDYCVLGNSYKECPLREEK